MKPCKKHFALLILANSFIFASQTQAQMEELTGREISISMDANTKSKINFLNRSGSKNPVKFQKFSDLIKRLPKQAQNSKNLDVASDESGELWTINGSLYDRESAKVLYQTQGAAERGMVTPNGKFLFVYEMGDDMEGNDQPPVIYHIPDMTKISSSVQGIKIVGRIGKGSYELIKKKDGTEWIADLENGFKLIRMVKKNEVWQADVCESADGNILLKQDLNGMTLYNLPSFEVVQHYKNMGFGTPIVNSTGNVIGCNHGVCYLTNRSTGTTKGYGIDRQNCEKLVECEYGEDYLKSISEGKVVSRKSVSKDKVNHLIDPDTLTIIKNPKESEGGVSLNWAKGKFDCGVRAVLTPSKSSAVLIVINRVRRQENPLNQNSGEAIAPPPALPPGKFIDDHNGDSLIVEVDEDLDIKKIFHYPRLLEEPFWDDETSSIVYQASENTYVQIQLTP